MIGRWFSRKRRSGGEDTAIVVKGARQGSTGDARLRIGMTMAVFLGIYAAIGGRLAYLGVQEVEAGADLGEHRTDEPVGEHLGGLVVDLHQPAMARSHMRASSACSDDG